MTVPDEAVEAAMKALLRMDDGAWAVVDATYIDHLEPQVRRSLEVAAPFIAAQAWDEGRLDGHAEAQSGYENAMNPYRSEQ